MYGGDISFIVKFSFRIGQASLIAGSKLLNHVADLVESELGISVKIPQSTVLQYALADNILEDISRRVKEKGCRLWLFLDETQAPMLA